MGISQSQTSEVVLGLVFMRNFYLIFDMEGDKVGLAKHKAMNSTLEYGLAYSLEVPSDNGGGVVERSGLDPVVIALIIIIVVCLLVVMALGGVWVFVWTRKAVKPELG